MSQPDRGHNPDSEIDGGGVSGKTVLVLLFFVSLVTVIIALTFIRPEPGDEPVPVNRRPFGPATPDEVQDQPLIERGGAARRQPANMPADE